MPKTLKDLNLVDRVLLLYCRHVHLPRTWPRRFEKHTKKTHLSWLERRQNTRGIHHRSTLHRGPLFFSIFASAMPILIIWNDLPKLSSMPSPSFLLPTELVNLSSSSSFDGISGLQRDQLQRNGEDWRLPGHPEEPRVRGRPLLHGHLPGLDRPVPRRLRQHDAPHPRAVVHLRGDWLLGHARCRRHQIHPSGLQVKIDQDPSFLFLFFNLTQPITSELASVFHCCQLGAPPWPIVSSRFLGFGGQDGVWFGSHWTRLSCRWGLSVDQTDQLTSQVLARVVVVSPLVAVSFWRGIPRWRTTESSAVYCGVWRWGGGGGST